MRKCLLVLACCFIILTCGCARNNNSPGKLENNVADSLMQPFESTLVIDYGELSAAAYFCKKPPAFCMIEFSKPEAIAGLKAEIESETATISYKGVAMTIDPSTIPGSAALKIIAAAIDSAVQRQGMKVTYNNGVIDVAGENENGSFNLKIDKENGNILKLSSPENKLDVRFTGFKFLD